MSCEESRSDVIILDTIRRFKRLEDLVVLLVVTASLALDDELIYVAISRARTHLVILGRPENIGVTQNLWREEK
jgi:superfamily I DNA and/or RNA helicase